MKLVFQNHTPCVLKEASIETFKKCYTSFSRLASFLENSYIYLKWLHCSVTLLNESVLIINIQIRWHIRCNGLQHYCISSIWYLKGQQSIICIFPHFKRIWYVDYDIKNDLNFPFIKKWWLNRFSFP